MENLDKIFTGEKFSLSLERNAELHGELRNYKEISRLRARARVLDKRGEFEETRREEKALKMASVDFCRSRSINRPRSANTRLF